MLKSHYFLGLKSVLLFLLAFQMSCGDKNSNQNFTNSKENSSEEATTPSVDKNLLPPNTIEAPPAIVPPLEPIVPVSLPEGPLFYPPPWIAPMPFFPGFSNGDDNHREKPFSELSIVKMAMPSFYSLAGQTINYTITVINSGTTFIKDINIHELNFNGNGLPPSFTCAENALEPGEQTICTATYITVQADVNASLTIVNTAEATGLSKHNKKVVSNESSASVKGPTIAPALTISKAVDPPSYTAAGQTITYTISVTNSGNTSITNIAINEIAFNGNGTAPTFICVATSLAAGASTTCTGSYQTVQADVDQSLTIANTAEATGLASNMATVTSNQSSATLSGPVAAPALTISKVANPLTYTAAGQTINYTISVTNSGNVTISSIAASDITFNGNGTAPTFTCLATILAPGASTTCTGTYQTVQADVDQSLTLVNTAVATGLAPNMSTVTSNQSSATVTGPVAAPALTINKTADPLSYTAAGQTISYTISVTNSGNVTISSIAASDLTFNGNGTAPTFTCMATSLAPGASTMCTGSYQTVQADVDASLTLENTAVATGLAPNTTTVTSNQSSATVTGPVAAPALTIGKTANPLSYTAAGQTISYTISVTNNGNVTISSIAASDLTFNGNGTAPTFTCMATSLAPGASTTCTGSYQTLQADVDASLTLENTAVATGLAPNMSTVTSNQSSATVAGPVAAPALTINKTANPLFYTAAGQSISYTISVTNSGNVTINSITASDIAFNGNGTAPTFTCLATTLAPGASTTCTGTYQTLQADVDQSLTLENTAVATGLAPNMSTVTSNQSSATVTGPVAAPALTIGKAANPLTYTAAGQTINYTISITNSGNVTISSIAASDIAFNGNGTAPTFSCLATTLAPGASTTCTGTYQTVQADVDQSLTLINTAVATGLAPNMSTVTSNQSSASVTGPAAAPALTINKAGIPSSYSAANQFITYRVTVNNSGNVTIHSIATSDIAFNGNGFLSSFSCLATTLAPGASTTCDAIYDTVQADVDQSLTLVNTAVTTGLAPNNATVTSNQSTAMVTGPAAAPALTIDKSADPTFYSTADQTISYSVFVLNSGNVTISSLGVSDTAFNGNGTAPTFTCISTSLAPGASTTCSGTYQTVQADVDADLTIVNTAEATGLAPDTSTVTSNQSTATVANLGPQRLVFVSSGNFDGNFGGIAGADAQCQTLAMAASLPGTYKAWISDSTSSPSTSFTQTGFFTLIDGTMIATSWADLTDGTIANPINRTDQNIVISNTFVRTNTLANGGNDSAFGACNNWTSNSPSDVASLGQSGATNSSWTTNSTGGCGFPLSIYCFEQ
jgi:uncharacterized repeat protein (TIGR01451 family)